MKKELVKNVGYTLGNLLDNIEMGIIGLPNLQREFVWSNTKVKDLFDSMYRGYPIGYLLFWENGLPDQHRPIGLNLKQTVPTLLIVDGQQRLTSLFAVIKNVPVIRNNRKEFITVAFRPRDGKFDVTDAAIERDPEWISNISQVWSKDTNLIRFANGFISNLRKSRDVSSEDEDKITEAIGDLHALNSYPFSVLQLSSTLGEDQVAEVFVRINSKGTPLNQADFILTLMSVFWDEGRKELESFCKAAQEPSSKASPYNHFIQPTPDQLLKVGIALGFRRARLEHVYSILRGKDLQTGEFSNERLYKQFSLLKEAQSYSLDLSRWHDFFNCILSSGFRRKDHISSQNALLYTYAMYLIGRKQFAIDTASLRSVIARWFFMATLTGRYTSSPESRMEQDLADLRDTKNSAGFIEQLNSKINISLTEDYWKTALPNELATSSARSPALFAYYAALNLLDANVLFSNLKVSQLMDPVLHSNKSALERHHLFPKAYLKTLEPPISEKRDTNQIANYALLEWGDNIGISSKSPREYLPVMINGFSQEELKKMCYWHALPEGWEIKSYNDFLEERRKRIAEVIHDGFSILEKGRKPDLSDSNH